jgi:hypothetical protein
MRSVLVWADGRVKFTDLPVCAFHIMYEPTTAKREAFSLSEIARVRDGAIGDNQTLVWVQVPESDWDHHCEAIKHRSEVQGYSNEK